MKKYIIPATRIINDKTYKMKSLYLASVLCVTVLMSCFGVKETEVNLSIMKLEKIDTVNHYPGIEIIYVWHIINGERRGEILYSYGKLNEPYLPGDVAYVFVKR